MSNAKPINWRVTIAAAGMVMLAVAASAGSAIAADIKVTLDGAQEVPPVSTSAKGEGMITVNDDKSLSGSVTTTGVDATMAHIHHGAPGKNGPIIVPFEKKSDGEWAVPANSSFTDEQYKAYQAGELYVNVHSAEHKGGEIRGQLMPK
ncbi:MAG TPA: CHRD domain-containing protein [Candidimonas sp.]|nr:CHRD domain-containing protein [Candidimonas sp.]